MRPDKRARWPKRARSHTPARDRLALLATLRCFVEPRREALSGVTLDQPRGTLDGSIIPAIARHCESRPNADYSRVPASTADQASDAAVLASALERDRTPCGDAGACGRPWSRFGLGRDGKTCRRPRRRRLIEPDPRRRAFGHGPRQARYCRVKELRQKR